MKIGYVTTEQLDQYCERHEIDLQADNRDLLALALHVVDDNDFIGEKTSKTQQAAWPRKNAWLSGVNLCSGTVPAEVCSAQITAALLLNKGRKTFKEVDDLIAPYLVADGEPDIEAPADAEVEAFTEDDQYVDTDAE